MTNSAIIAALTVVLSGCATWSVEDKQRQGIWYGLHAIDCTQTLQIARNPDQYSEASPLLSRHPSKGEVLTVCALLGVVHPIIVHAYPENRRFVQNLSIGLKGAAVMWNYHHGLGK